MRSHKSPARVRAEAAARSLANLRGVGGNQGPRPPIDRPAITEAGAALFTQLTAAGLSPSDALAYLAPAYHASLRTQKLDAWVTTWCNAPVVVRAITAWNHGPWHELAPDRRVTLAIEHHIAQVAYVLYTSDYTNPQADMAKIRDARGTLLEWLKSAGKVEDAMTQAIRDILEGKTSASGPPQLQGATAGTTAMAGTAAAQPPAVPIGKTSRPH